MRNCYEKLRVTGCEFRVEVRTFSSFQGGPKGHEELLDKVTFVVTSSPSTYHDPTTETRRLGGDYFLPGRETTDGQNLLPKVGPSRERGLPVCEDKAFSVLCLRAPVRRSVMKALEINELTGQVIGAAIEVHKALGPGLPESVYEACLCMELDFRSVPYQRQ
jgi:hypothetical protein